MTALILAVLTDRALCLDWPGHKVALTTPRLHGGARLLAAARAGVIATRFGAARALCLRILSRAREFSR